MLYLLKEKLQKSTKNLTFCNSERFWFNLTPFTDYLARIKVHRSMGLKLLINTDFRSKHLKIYFRCLLVFWNFENNFWMELWCWVFWRKKIENRSVTFGVIACQSCKKNQKIFFWSDVNQKLWQISTSLFDHKIYHNL